VKAGLKPQSAQQERYRCKKNNIYRSFLAIGTIAARWSAPVALRAAELHPLVVIGIPLDKVATVHPTPEYPRTAFALGIDGQVRIKMKVRDGRIVEADASSGSPMLGYAAKQWILRNWKFRHEISGVFTLPVNYKRQA
jgi:outer membrane biosynthesis protein TonB